MGPQPVTSTDLPTRLPARRVAWRQTASGSAIAASPGVRPSATAHCDGSTFSTCRNAPWMCGKGIAEP